MVDALAEAEIAAPCDGGVLCPEATGDGVGCSEGYDGFDIIRLYDDGLGCEPVGLDQSRPERSSIAEGS